MKKIKNLKNPKFRAKVISLSKATKELKIKYKFKKMKSFIE